MSCRKPLILAGHGVRVSGLYEPFRQWIDTANIPVVTTQLASDLMPWDHPLYVGHPGIKGDRAGNLAIQNCDLLFVVGSSLHPSTTGYNLGEFAPHAERVILNLDQPFPGLVSTDSEAWLKQCQIWKKTLMVRDEPHDRSQLNYYDVIEALSVAAPAESTIVADAGMAYYITGQAWRTKKGQRLIFPGSLAQMGYTLPAVTGVCMAVPRRVVIGITGDGSFQTNIHELAVIALHKLNAKLLVVNNGGYACIRNTQMNYFDGHLSGTDESNGVFITKTRRLCEAYGLSCFSPRNPNNLMEFFIDFLDRKGPLVGEVFTNPNQEFMPVVKSYRQPDGTMTSGKLEEMWPPKDVPQGP